MFDFHMRERDGKLQIQVTQLGATWVAGTLWARVSGKGAPLLTIVYVDPRFRRQGIARRLVGRLELLYGECRASELHTEGGALFWGSLGKKSPQEVLAPRLAELEETRSRRALAHAERDRLANLKALQDIQREKIRAQRSTAAEVEREERARALGRRGPGGRGSGWEAAGGGWRRIPHRVRT